MSVGIGENAPEQHFVGADADSGHEIVGLECACSISV